MPSLDVQRVISALPRPGAPNDAKLRTLPTEALMEVLLDAKRQWWRRKPCADALSGRLTAQQAPQLWKRVVDPKETAEVARACLAVLAGTWKTSPPDGALAWLRAQEHRQLKHGMNEAVLQARGRMGDLSSAAALAELVFSPWAHRRQTGREAMERLAKARGTSAVVRELGARGDSWAALLREGTNAAARFTALALDPTIGVAACFAALADAHVAVAHAANRRLVAAAVPTEQALSFVDARLEALAGSHGAAPPLTGDAAAACWALLVAASTTPSYAVRLEVQTRWNEVGQPCLTHSEVPDAVRRAILREYLPGQRETDPRLLVEGLLMPAAPATEDERPEHAWTTHAALVEAGFAAADPVSAGMEYRQGAGTYHVVRTANFAVTVSELGPWIDSDDAPPAARRAMAAAGLEELDGALLRRRFEGLPVYFFGDRQPLPIRDLLFYWQD